MQSFDAGPVASIEPPSTEPATSARRGLPSWALPPVVLLVVALAWFAHAGLGTSLALVGTALLLPIGRYAAERAILAALLVSAVVGVVFVLMHVPVARTTATAFVLALPVLAAAASVLRHRDAPLRRRLPRVGLPDVAVLVVAGASAWWVLASSYGMSLRDTLARLYHGWDWVLHTTMYTDVYRYGRLAGLEIDGSPAFLSANPQLHPALWATGTWAGQPGSASMPGEQLLQAGILATAVTFAICVGALAWLAADLTTAIAGRSRRDLPAAAAAIGAGAATGGGIAAAVYFFGHTPFLLGVTALAVGSYLAVRPSRHGAPASALRGLVLLLASAVVLLLEWPPLILGLGLAGALVVLRVVRGHRRTTIALSVAAVVVLLTSPWWYERLTGAVTIDALSDAPGVVTRYSLPLTFASILVTLAAGAALGTHRDHGRAVGILGPVLGMLAFAALLMAHGSIWWGESPSYYLLKTLLGCLIATTPVLVAVVVGGFVRLAAHTRRPTPDARLWGALASGTAVVILLATVISPPDSIGRGAPWPLEDPPRFVTYSDTIARAYPVTPAVPSQVPFLADYGDERADLWLLVLQRGVSDADHDFYVALPAFYPPQLSNEADSLVPPPADWGAVICAQLRLRPSASFIAMTEHPVEVRRWAREVGRSCDTSRLSVLEIPR